MNIIGALAGKRKEDENEQEQKEDNCNIGDRTVKREQATQEIVCAGAATQDIRRI